jgi:hypothetical protein
MKYVRLQYTGKKPSLHLTMARLKAEYIFEKDNGMTAPVEYEAAAYLLQTNMAIFTVVGGPFEAEEKPALELQEEPRAPGLIVAANDWKENTASGALTVTAWKARGQLPRQRRIKTHGTEEPKGTTKKGKNK